MDNEMKDMLNLILGKLSRLEEGQKKLEKGQANLEKGQVILEKRQDEMFRVVKAIESSNIEARAKQDSLEHRVAHIEGTVNAVGEVLRQERA